MFGQENVKNAFIAETLSYKKVRIITQDQLLRLMKSYPKIFTPNFKSQLKHPTFRCSQEHFLVEMMIFDKETLFVSTEKQISIDKMVWFRTNKPLMLEMAKGYFEALWEKAPDCKILPQEFLPS